MLSWYSFGFFIGFYIGPNMWWWVAVVWLSFVKRLVIGLFCGERLPIIADFHGNMHFTQLKGLGNGQI